MSINKITYLDQFYKSGIFSIIDPLIEIFQFNDYIETSRFLSRLEDDKIYVITFEFIPSFIQDYGEDPTIFLSKPVLITKNSNPRLISNFINERIQLSCRLFYLDDSLLENNMGPGVIIKYKEINLF